MRYGVYARTIYRVTVTQRQIKIQKMCILCMCIPYECKRMSATWIYAFTLPGQVVILSVYRENNGVLDSRVFEINTSG